MEINPVLPIAG